MIDKFFPPKFKVDNFHCPNCNVYAFQRWYDITYSSSIMKRRTYHGELYEFSLSKCDRCDRAALWLNQKLIHPRTSLVSLPAGDMPKDVKEDYLEARNIVSDSQRAAAALLRLALEKLMTHLGEEGKKLDEAISSLVKKGLPDKIQKSLDIIRVIGNNAVHPGVIDLKDDIKTATVLFNLLNKIVEVMITQPKEIDEVYETIPEGARKAIEKRDKE